MGKEQRKIAALATALAVACATILALVASRTIPKRDDAHEQNASQNASTKSSDAVDWVLSAGTWEAAFTGVIAFFTITLWWTGRVQAQLTRDAVNLARDEFTSTHRPRLHVREIAVPLGAFPDMHVTCFVEIANVGETAARIVASNVGFDLVTEARFVRSAREIERRNDFGVGETFPPGGSERITLTTLEWMWTSQTWKSYSDNRLGFFVFGHIIYEDAGQIRRQLAFRRKYDPTWRRFVRVDGTAEELEYSD